MARRVVDLPQPLGPSSPTNSPSPTLSDTSETIGLPWIATDRLHTSSLIAPPPQLPLKL